MTDMSNDVSGREKFEAQQQATKARLLKANNVQRRRFERMVDDAEQMAKRKAREIDNDHREIVRQAVVKDAIGEEDLAVLHEIKRRILSLQAQIEATKKLADPVRERMVKAGLVASDRSSERWGSDSLAYFTNPDPEKEDDDVCREVIGDEALKSIQIKQCRANPTWAEYERRTLDVALANDQMENDAEELRAKVWQLVTTDEIVKAIQEFKEQWIYE